MLDLNTQDPNDPLDVMSILSPAEGSGYWRDIKLREGLKILIGDFRMRDRFLATSPEREFDQLQYHFHFSGTHLDEEICISADQFAFFGTGLAPKTTEDILGAPAPLDVFGSLLDLLPSILMVRT